MILQKEPGAGRLIKGLILSYPYPIVALLLLSVLGTLFSLATPLVLGYLIDSVLIGKNIAVLVPILLGLTGLFIFSALSDYLANTIRGRLNLVLFRELAKDLFGAVQEASLVHIQRMKTGDLLTRTMGNTTSAVQTVTSILPQIAITIIGFILPFLIMMSLDPKLALIATSPVILFMASSWYFGRKIRKIQRRSLDTAAGMTSFLKEAYSIVPLTKAFVLGQWIRRKFDAHMDRYYEASCESIRISSLSSSAGLVIYGIPTLLVLALGSAEVLAGTITLGTFTAFIGYIGLFFSPVQMLSTLWTSYKSSLASFDRIEEIFLLGKESWGKNSIPPIVEQIEYRNVWFSYGQRPVLRGFSAIFRPGRNYIVGENGSGKTTLIQILCGIYQPEKGLVLINGIDLTSINGDSLRKAVSIVFSDLQVFDGTIEENIRVGDVTASQEKIIKAAKIAGLHEFIMKLPDGYATTTGEGGQNLSSGEKQKIALARVILRDSPVIIFDEFTRSIDIESKKAIYSVIRKLENKIIIIITHDAADIESSANRVTISHWTPGAVSSSISRLASEQTGVISGI